MAAKHADNGHHDHQLDQTKPSLMAKHVGHRTLLWINCTEFDEEYPNLTRHSLMMIDTVLLNLTVELHKSTNNQQEHRTTLFSIVPHLWLWR